MAIEIHHCRVVRPPQLRHQQAVHIARHVRLVGIDLGIGLGERVEAIAAVAAEVQLLGDLLLAQPCVIIDVRLQRAIGQLGDMAGEIVEKREIGFTGVGEAAGEELLLLGCGGELRFEHAPEVRKMR